MRTVLVLAVVALFAATAPSHAAGRQVEAIVQAYSDSELITGFERTVFGAEDPAQRRREGWNRVKKFAGRVRVHLINLSGRDRRAEVRRFVAKLDRTVAGLSMSITESEQRAGMVVFLVDRRDYRDVILETMPAHLDTRFLLANDCSAVTGGRHGHRLDRAFVYLVADEGQGNFRHCMIEEIVQSLGPVNDDRRLTNSIFNDYSRVGSFSVFDWFILNMLYDRRVKTGMTRAEVAPVLPAVIADARNRLRRLVRGNKIQTR